MNAKILQAALLFSLSAAPSLAWADEAQCDLLRRRAEEKVHEGEQQRGTRQKELFNEAAEAYLSIWNEFGLATQPACSRMEEVLWNAAAAFHAAGQSAKSIKCYEVLLDPTHGLQKTQLAMRASFRLGDAYLAIGMFDKAASWFLRFAREAPREKEAKDALQDALRLELALGQKKEALESVELYQKYYGSKKPEDTAMVMLTYASYELEHGGVKEVKAHLKQWVPAIDRARAPDLAARAHALLGKALVEEGDEQSAANEYKLVNRLLENNERLAQRLINEPGRLGRALMALGEARFFLADRTREEASALRLPLFRGKGTPARDRYLKRELAPILQKKMSALTKAESAYQSVLEIEPASPPRWVVESAGQVALMWIDAIEELDKVSRSLEPTIDKALREAYEGAVDSMASPLKQKARGACLAYQRFAVKFQFSTAHAARCDAWLARNYPQQHARLDELLPQPIWQSGGAAATEPLAERREP